MSTTGPAGVVLAAGAGRRLRPLTDLRPKAMCPVAGTALVDLALSRLAPVTGVGPDHQAVNAHHLADQVLRHCDGRARVSVEPGEALGTAGGLARLRGWLDGRDVLVTNADSYLPEGLGSSAAGLTTGWDGRRCRLLCVPAPPGSRPDFTGPDGRGLRYVGACLLPWAAVATLATRPSGLYEVLWAQADSAGDLEFLTPHDLRPIGDRGEPAAIDCGTPRDYLAANLHASGGASVVGDGAVVEGVLERSVVWDGAWVGPRERLCDTIRAGTRADPVTVHVPPGPAPGGGRPAGAAKVAR